MLLRHLHRLSSGRVRGFATNSHAVVYSSFGSPQKVLNLKEITLDDPSGSEVLVKMLAAPINPADINMIEGSYPIAPEGEEKIAGNEGLGVVESVGPNVTDLKNGDWVLPRRPGFGTWRTHALTDQSNLRKIAQDLPLQQAATLAVNPCTAYRLLHDFEKLSQGDVIVQNACNGAVGQLVIQLARAKGIKTINILRNRPNFAETVEYCKSLGGDIVVTEDYVRTPAFKTLTADLPKPKLALNAVGGKSATDLARVLADGGTMVTYGGMSRKPVTLPTGLLIFKNIQSKGFWLSKWTETHSDDEVSQMISEVSNAVKNKPMQWIIRSEHFEDFLLVMDGLSHQKYSDGKRLFIF